MYSRKTDDWITDIKELQQNSRDRKSTQPIGAGSLLMYKTSTSALNDYNFTLLQTTPLRFFRVTFTHATSQRGALLSLKVFVGIDTPDVMSSPFPYFTSVGAPALVRWKKDTTLSSDSQTVWTIAVAKGNPGTPSYQVYFKFFIDGTDTGSWIVTAL